MKKLILFLGLFLSLSQNSQAATIIAAAGAAGNWTTGSTWIGGNAPTAADDAQIPLATTSITINSGAVCRSADFTGFTGTITHNASATLTIGDGTAGLSNIALKLAGTYNLGSATTSAISFVSTSATVQTVDFAGKTTGNVTYNAASNGSWQLTGTHNTGSTATVTLTKGTLDTNGQTCSWGLFNSSNSNVRTLTLGASAIAITQATATTFTFATSTNLTFNANTSTITLASADNTFSGGGKTFNVVNFTGSGTHVITDANTFGTLNRTGTAVKTDVLQLNAGQTVTGTLTLAGNSVTNRLFVTTNTIGTAFTITNSGATMTWSNVDFRDITLGTAFDASAITGNSGDCGGNTNITFTTAASQTSTGTSSFTWSTHGWTTRVPLPQDDVTVSNTFTASQTVTMDMPRLGKSITFNCNAVSITKSITTSSYGSLTLDADLTTTNWTGTNVFEGRGSFTLTNAGLVMPSTTISAVGGTYTIQDAMSMTRSGASTFTLDRGTFNANNFNVTAGVFTISGTGTRTCTMGSGTWSYNASNASGTPWNATTTTNLTFNANTSTIKCVTNSGTAKTFAGGGLTYNNVWFADAGAGVNQMTGSSTFNDFRISAARTVNFTAGTTQTVTSFTGDGAAGNNVVIGSITASNHTLTKAGGGTICEDYMTISRSTATPGTTWFAGSNSTDNGNNSGWTFTPCSTGNFFQLFY